MKIRQTLGAIGALTWLAWGSLAAQRSTLSGTVVDGTSDQPLAGVELTLQTGQWKDVGAPAISDGQGRFAFRGLAPGEYSLSAEGSGFGRVYYGESLDSVSSIRMGGQGGDKSIVFRIVPRGAIEGTIRDEFGDSMVRALVSVVRPVWRDGRPVMSNVARKSTDDRGRYRFGNLAPGNYVVCAEGDQNTQAPVQGPVDYTTRVDNRFYTRTCNRAFQLSPGQRAQVDLSPPAGPAATVRGHVRNAPPQTGFQVYLSPEAGSEGWSRVGALVDAAQGTYVLRGVAPGRYRLRASAYASTGGVRKDSMAVIPVDVGTSDMDGVDVVLDSGGTVDVALHGLAENQIEPKDVSVNLRGVDAIGDNHQSTGAKDGGFHLDGLAPGSYRLSLAMPEDICVESVKLGGREVRGLPFDVPGGAAVHLDVAVSRNCGAIRMRAMRDDAAVPGAKVVLLLSGTAKDPGELKEDFANDEGEFWFSGLTPGRYLVWAWAVEGKGAMAGPASLAAVEQQATVVEVTAGDPVRVDVPLLADEGKG